MAEPSRRMREPRRDRANLGWSVLFVIASVLGGLAAADVTHESSLVAVLFSLLVAAIMVIILYQGMLDQSRPSGDRRPGPATAPLRQEPPTAPVGRQGTGGAHRAAAERQAAERQAAERQAAPTVEPGLVQLVQPQSGGWWQGHVASTEPAGRTGAAASSRPRPRQVDLSQFLDSTLIAQCPRCGGFAIEADNRAAEWLFACKECQQRWTWQPGTSWPGIQVRPEARGRTDRTRP